jgi:probable phosphoglycerate mutase
MVPCRFTFAAGHRNHGTHSRRSRQTRAAVSTDALLKELSYGKWEGLTLPELERRDPDGFRGREADKWGFVPPAGESYAIAAGRVVRWLEALHEPALVVAHGGILRILLHHLGGLPAHDAPHLATPQDRAVLFTRVAVFTI